MERTNNRPADETAAGLQAQQSGDARLRRIACIALGANIGDRERMLQAALERLNAHPDIEVTGCSSVYETAPVGYADQGAFLNMAALVATTLDPVMLLRFMLATELELGRTRVIRNGPRTIDLDLLAMAGVAMDTPELQLPHPRMMERAFVLVPLSEVLGEAVRRQSAAPNQGGDDPLRPLRAFAGSVDQALQLLDGKEGIELWKRTVWHGASVHFVS